MKKKVTYLLLCVLKTQTPILVLFVNLLMDFDASVPIDQTEPSLTAERTLGHRSSWANLENIVMRRRRLELLGYPRPHGVNAALRSDREEVGVEWKANNPFAAECMRTVTRGSEN